MVLGLYVHKDSEQDVMGGWVVFRVEDCEEDQTSSSNDRCNDRADAQESFPLRVIRC